MPSTAHSYPICFQKIFPNLLRNLLLGQRPGSRFVGKPTDDPSSSGFTSRRYAAIHFRACCVGHHSFGDPVTRDTNRCSWEGLFASSEIWGGNESA